MLLSTSSVTGPAELCLDDAKGLKKAGHTVVFGLDTKRAGNYAQAIKAVGYEVMEELTLCRKPTPMEFARDVARLRKRLGNVDLVHCRFSHDHTVALAAMQRLKARPALVRTAETANSMRSGLLRGVAFRACDAVIVSCQRYQQHIRGTFKLPAGKVHVVPGRVDVRRWNPHEAADMRKAWGVAPNEVVFGIVARIKPDRLHDVVLRSFARVALEMPKAKLAIIGRGEHERAVREMATGLGLEGRVIFAGYPTGEELAVSYSALDAKIWLAEGNDGTCRAVLEAMACGVPIVAGDSGAMAELVRDGVDGYVVKATDEAVAEALRKLTDPKVRKALGRSALERAAEFTPKARAAKLAEVYSSALKVSGR
jgi:glycosyltransferase involved in cell wall biosynthesis